MTQRERRALLAAAVVLALVCSVLFARAVLVRRASDLFRAQARAALVSADIEEQLTARKEHGMRPLIAVLAKARREAADALAALADAARV